MTRTDKIVRYSPKSKDTHLSQPSGPSKTCAPEAAEEIFRVLQGRWKLAILFHLFGGVDKKCRVMRFSELERAIPAISQKMLIQQLRELERDGIVMCQLVAVSRRGFYRSLRQREPAEEETEVRSLIQQIALEHRRRYGYRRITAELHRRGVQVNRKRVARMMRDDNLLAIQPKRFVVTTNSKHKCEVYLNLASRMTLTGINQLWVADITYVRLKGEFVYLAVILDSFSRKVVGWLWIER